MSRRRLAAAASVVLVPLALAISLHGQEEKDPIDTRLESCLASPSGVSTVGQIECARTAGEAWDAELNKAYQKLMKSLDPVSRDLLRASQRQWIAFRDGEKKFQTGPWTRQQGTLIGPSIALLSADAVRSRVMTLRGYSGGNP